MIIDSLPNHLFTKEKRPESLPPENLLHLLQSVQVRYFSFLTKTRSFFFAFIFKILIRLHR